MKALGQIILEWGNNFGWTNFSKKIWTNFSKVDKIRQNRRGQTLVGGTNFRIIGTERGTNFGKGGQSLAEIRSKMAEILRE
jgi:hypothetical protein